MIENHVDSSCFTFFKNYNWKLMNCFWCRKFAESHHSISLFISNSVIMCSTTGHRWSSGWENPGHQFNHTQQELCARSVHYPFELVACGLICNAHSHSCLNPDAVKVIKVLWSRGVSASEHLQWLPEASRRRISRLSQTSSTRGSKLRWKPRRAWRERSSKTSSTTWNLRISPSRNLYQNSRKRLKLSQTSFPCLEYKNWPSDLTIISECLATLQWGVDLIGKRVFVNVIWNLENKTKQTLLHYYSPKN